VENVLPNPRFAAENHTPLRFGKTIERAIYRVHHGRSPSESLLRCYILASAEAPASRDAVYDLQKSVVIEWPSARNHRRHIDARE